MTDNRDMPEGPRAFPLPSASFGPSGDMSFPEEGMLLRDWFAGQALPRVLSSQFRNLATGELIDGEAHELAAAEAAYRVADAMLTERTKRDTQ